MLTVILISFFVIIYFCLNNRKKSVYEYVFVTAIYAGKSKHSINEYKLWIKYFSNLINKNLFIFCNKEGYEMLTPSLKKFVISKNEIFELEQIKKYENVYKLMWKIDPEKNIHNYRLYGIWNGKICMLKYVSERIDSKLYIWVDIGSNRENKSYTIYPSINVIKYLQKITKIYGLFFFQLAEFPKVVEKNISIINSFAIEGTSFGGNKKAIKEYHDVYFSLHDEFMKRNTFVGKDQELFNTIYYYNMCKLMVFKYKSNKCQNDWFFRFYDFYGGNSCAEVEEHKNGAA